MAHRLCRSILNARARRLRWATRGLTLVESMLSLVVFSVAIGAIIKIWVQDHQIQQVQRQAEVLETARRSSQKLITLYRSALASTASPQLSTKVDGTALTTPILPTSTAGAGNTNLWSLSGDQLVELQLLDSGFPTSGLYGSLSGAQLQLNLSASRSDQKITGTLCYNQPLLKDGKVDLSALGTLLAQASRGIAVVGANSINGSGQQGGVFVASYPGDGAHLKGSASDISIDNTFSGTEGIVCGLVGDWGGLESTGRLATAMVSLGGACTEPNALAWLDPGSASAQPQNIVWCDGIQWKLLNAASVGDGCTAGRTAINSDSNSDTYLQPLMCDKSNKMVAGRLLPFKDNITCNAGAEGRMAAGLNDQRIFRCTYSNSSYSWLTAFLPVAETTLPGVPANSSCASFETNTLGQTSSGDLLVCAPSGNWTYLRW